MKSRDLVYIEAKLQVFIVCLGCLRFVDFQKLKFETFLTFLTTTYFRARLSQAKTSVVLFVWELLSDRGVVRVFEFDDIDDRCFYIYFISEIDIQIIKVYVQHNC
jgi:hypothetical protein